MFGGGGGTSSIFVCRRRSDASLVWVKSAWNYRLDIPGQLAFTFVPVNNARVTLAVHKERLYITTLFTNIGPQLFCIDKTTGNPIWTMAYEPPISLGQPFLVSPSTAINSFDGSPYIGQSISMGDLHLNVVELTPNNVSVFVGISSFQNAINSNFVFGGFPRYTDQGGLIRVDDLGNTATKVWKADTCALRLQDGDIISSTGPDAKNPYRTGSTTTLIWRETTNLGTFSTPQGVIGKILDNTGANPGYVPAQYPLNNLTMPIVANVFLYYGATVTEVGLNIPSIFRSQAPGIGFGYISTAVVPAQSMTVAPFVLNVTSTTGFPGSGSIIVRCFDIPMSPPQCVTVTYSGVTATSFTGCVAPG